MYSVIEKIKFVEKKTKSEALLIAESQKSIMNSNNSNIVNQNKTRMEDLDLTKKSKASPNKNKRKTNH